MSNHPIRWIPLFGLGAAFVLLAIAAIQYDGDDEWTRVTVSMLCAANLSDGTPNATRLIAVPALLLLCVSMALLFELISRTAGTKGQRKTIQIAGIGSMVYALLTATPMHNLMVNVALVFFLVAVIAVVYALIDQQRYVLAFIGVACLLVKLGSVTLYYTNINHEIWGVLQKVSFIATTLWLSAVLLIRQRQDNQGLGTSGLATGSKS